MQILVNGRGVAVAPGSTVSMLVERLELAGRFALEVNEMIVLRSRYAACTLNAGDRVEIIHAVGGGMNPCGGK